MKAKYILLAFLSFGLSYNAEAQFLKKLKKKAEQAAERTVLRKTDEIVSGKTEKTIDNVAEGNADGNENKKPKDTVSSNEPVNQTTTSRSPSSNPFGGGKKAEKLPESYAFDWEYKTEMKVSFILSFS